MKSDHECAPVLPAIAGRLWAAGRKFLSRLAPLGFSLRTMLACALALLAAFSMQLEAPYWAALTVWIIAHPHPSQTWGKGLFRILGTTLGAIVAIVLVQLFNQTPELFLGSLALWCGVCTAAAIRLKNFHSYAAMLAGYSTAIVSMAVIHQPLHVFETAVARATCVILGVAAVSVVSAIFHRNSAGKPARSTPSMASPRPSGPEALLGGLRTVGAIAAAGTFWIATASSTAATLLLVTAIMCALFSTHPAPHHASMGFGVATLLSGVAAFVCVYLLIQSVESFPMLILCMALFLIPGGMAMVHPRTAFFGVGFSVNFMNQVMPTNPMHYDLSLFLNNLTASLAGSGVAALAFLILFPRTISHD